MAVHFDQQQLLNLVSSLYTLTGIRANILNGQGLDICLTTDHAPFCELMNARPEGHERCINCDRGAVQRCAGRKGFYRYRCHAGICEAVLPIRSGDEREPLAYLVYGQLLDDSPLEKQWENSRKLLGWWQGDMEELRQAYFRFRQYSETELKAYSEILEALASYIRLERMILTTEMTDMQKLELYLNQHYMEKLSLNSISSQLHIGRTKLCMLAKELSGGKTLSHLITERRIEAARNLLIQSDIPISSVAEQVGIEDYNYFSKVFRAVVGTTPSNFRKAARRGRFVYKK